MNKDFPRIITLLRKEKNLNQKDVANDLGVSQALLSHYEKGIRECSLDFVVKIADYYEVSTDYLLGRSTQRYSDITDVDEEVSDEKRKAISQIVSKKLITNSINLLYEYLIKIGSRKLSNQVSNYLNLTVYDLFRMIYESNDKNPNNLYLIDDVIYKNYISSILDTQKAKISALTDSRNEVEYISSCKDITISPQSISEEFPSLASSLLNIIQHSENTIRTNIK